MAFGPHQSLALSPGNGEFATPLAAVAEMRVAVSNLRSAATIAQVRDPITAALANVNPIDITGVTRIRAYGRGYNLPANFTDARVMFFAGLCRRIERVNDSVSQLVEVSHIERMDGTDITTALGATSGLAVGFPTAPSAANMMARPDGRLVTPPILFTDASGNVRPYLDVASFNFLLVLPVYAATGTAALSNEINELAVASAN